MHVLATGCPPLDDLLDGGLESDAIILVFGEGGSGKTNLALQLARRVTAGGRRVAYVDTEGVSQRRLEQVFSALPASQRIAAEERLLFYNPYNIEEQEQMVRRTALLRDVGLIVIDSINMHYRLHIDVPGGEKEASRSLYGQLHHLTQHARQHHIPVLVTGQVYGGENDTQPFARRVMEHLVKALVRFEKRPDGSRRATVLKHRSIEEGRQARFRIGATGLEPLDGAAAPTATAVTPAVAPPLRPPHPTAEPEERTDDPDQSAPSTHPAQTDLDPTPPPSAPTTRPGDLDAVRPHPHNDERDADAWDVDPESSPTPTPTPADPLETGRDAAAPALPRPQPRPPSPRSSSADQEAEADAQADDAPPGRPLREDERRAAEGLPGFTSAADLLKIDPGVPDPVGPESAAPSPTAPSPEDDADENRPKPSKQQE